MSTCMAAARRFHVCDGTIRDYEKLAHHHYHTAPPATHVRVLVARDRHSHELAGALVVSMPALNGSWRTAAFGESRYRSKDRRADAARLNEELRTISRVVVESRYRGMGVGTMLVKRYLRRPLTRVTEALAAMGAFSGFFAAAGMTRIEIPASERDLRLMDALAALGIDPWMTAAPEMLSRDTLGSLLLNRELQRWAQGTKGDRSVIREGTAALLRRAAVIFHRPIAYIALRLG